MGIGENCNQCGTASEGCLAVCKCTLYRFAIVIKKQPKCPGMIRDLKKQRQVRDTTCNFLGLSSATV
jgi:hypothetical protein